MTAQEAQAWKIGRLAAEMLRACWVTQLVTGFEVMPAIRTKRLSWWTNTRT